MQFGRSKLLRRVTACTLAISLVVTQFQFFGKVNAEDGQNNPPDDAYTITLKDADQNNTIIEGSTRVINVDIPQVASGNSIQIPEVSGIAYSIESNGHVNIDKEDINKTYMLVSDDCMPVYFAINSLSDNKNYVQYMQEPDFSTVVSLDTENNALVPSEENVLSNGYATITTEKIGDDYYLVITCTSSNQVNDIVVTDSDKMYFFDGDSYEKSTDNKYRVPIVADKTYTVAVSQRDRNYRVSFNKVAGRDDFGYEAEVLNTNDEQCQSYSKQSIKVKLVYGEEKTVREIRKNGALLDSIQNNSMVSWDYNSVVYTYEINGNDVFVVDVTEMNGQTTVIASETIPQDGKIRLCENIYIAPIDNENNVDKTRYLRVIRSNNTNYYYIFKKDSKFTMKKDTNNDDQWFWIVENYDWNTFKWTDGFVRDSSLHLTKYGKYFYSDVNIYAIVDKYEPKIDLDLNSSSYLNKSENVNLSVDACYNSDVAIPISITDLAMEGVNVGGAIKSASYAISYTNQANELVEETPVVLYSSTDVNQASNAITDEYVEISAADHNYDNIKITVTAEDFAGNTNTKEYTIKINIDRPALTVSYGGQDEDSFRIIGNKIYTKNAFPFEVSMKELRDEYSLANAQGAIIVENENNYDCESTEWVLDQQNDLFRKQFIIPTGNKNGKYTVKLDGEINRAKLKGKVVSFFGQDVSEISPEITEFTVYTDEGKPVLELVNDESIENSVPVENVNLIDEDSFENLGTESIFASPNRKIYVKATDEISGVMDVSAAYISADETISVDTYSFTSIANDVNDENVIGNIGVNPGSSDCRIVFRVTDKCGNIAYFCTPKIIIDDSEPVINPSSVISIGGADSLDTINNDVLYCNGNSEITVKVTKNQDKSKLKSVKVYKNSIDENNIIEYSGNNNGNYERTIKFNVKPEDGISSIIIVAMDNAKNKGEKTITVKNDSVKPEIKVTYDGQDCINNRDDNRGKYFLTNLKKNLVVSINEDNLTDSGLSLNRIGIYKLEGNNEIALADTNNSHVTYTINKGGEYIIKAKGVDKAGNITDYAKKIIVDDELPKLDVSVEYSNKNVSNKQYVIGNAGNPNEIYSKDAVSINVKASDNFDAELNVGYTFTDVVTGENGSGTIVLNKNDKKTITVSANSSRKYVFSVKDSASNEVSRKTMIITVDDDLSAKDIKVDDVDGIINSDIRISASVKMNSKDYAGKTIPRNGIARISCTIDGTVVYSFAADKTTNRNLLEKDFYIPVSAKSFNHDNAKLVVTVIDNAGYSVTKEQKLSIDTTAPKTVLKYDNINSTGLKDGVRVYSNGRKLTVRITERKSGFDAGAAKKSIEIMRNDEAIDISKCSFTTKDSEIEDRCYHDIEIDLDEAGKYSIKVDYTDKAGNRGSIVRDSFYIDMTSPKISIESSLPTRQGILSDSSKVLAKNLSFELFGNGRIETKANIDDELTGVREIKYYKTNKTKLLTVDELKKLSGSSWVTYKNGTTIKSGENDRLIIYFMATDNAGNTSYASTNGMVADTKQPSADVIPAISITSNTNDNSVYNSDVKMKISVKEPKVNEAASGLNSVVYSIINNDTNEHSSEVEIINVGKVEYAEDNLISNFEHEIVVDANKYNSNNIMVRVVATDNSGNTATAFKEIKIDTTKPEISISYDNNEKKNGSFYDANRTAKIYIRERNFNKNKVSVKVTRNNTVVNTNGIVWNTTEGTAANKDNTLNVGTFVFDQDGDYKVSIEYTDEAGNKADDVIVTVGTQDATEFSIDKTKPEVSVSYNNAALKKYFDKEVEAIIIVNEHNFDSRLIKLDVVVDNNNQGSYEVGSWSSTGDIHKLSIKYKSDANYSFTISATDMAGNESEAYTKDEFCIDTQAPTIVVSNISDEKAYDQEIIAPEIICSDINYSNSEVTLAGSQNGVITITKGEKTGDGIKYTLDNIQKDDVYTLTVEAVDKSSNSETRSIKFSVNRNGSSYEVSDSTVGSLNKYVQKMDDVVVSEINTNKLESTQVTVIVNGVSKKLVENEDYSVSEVLGSSGWYEYSYSIFAKNFTSDGSYEIEISSKDALGRISNNNYEAKGSTVKFGIDNTKPSIIVANLESDKTYAVDGMTVNFSASDNLLLSQIDVYLDNYSTPFMSVSREEIKNASSDMYSFNIPGDSTSAHKIKIVGVDAAGNEEIQEFTDVYVTTNIAVRLSNNKTVIIIVGGVAALIIVVGAALLIRKRKNR